MWPENLRVSHTIKNIEPSVHKKLGEKFKKRSDHGIKCSNSKFSYVMRMKLPIIFQPKIDTIKCVAEWKSITLLEISSNMSIDF